MNIAIIDDEKLWRNMAHKLVQNHYAGVDINIEEFESGDSFLERKGNFDFVLVDIEMPGKDGFETICPCTLISFSSVSIRSISLGKTESYK